MDSKLDIEKFLMLTESVTQSVISLMQQEGLEHVAKDPNMIATLMASSLGMLIGSTTQQTKGARDEILKNVDRLLHEAIDTADRVCEK